MLLEIFDSKLKSALLKLTSISKKIPIIFYTYSQRPNQAKSTNNNDYIYTLWRLLAIIEKKANNYSYLESLFSGEK